MAHLKGYICEKGEIIRKVLKYFLYDKNYSNTIHILFLSIGNYSNRNALNTMFTISKILSYYIILIHTYSRLVCAIII